METLKLTILLLPVMYTSFLVYTPFQHSYSACKLRINKYTSERCSGNFSQEISIVEDPNRIRLGKRIQSIDLSRRRPNKVAYMWSLLTKLDHALCSFAGGRCGLESSAELVWTGMLMVLPAHLLISGLVVLVILSIIGWLCLMSVKEHHYVEWTTSDTNILELIGMPSAEQQLVINHGLDQHIIDTYPKIVLNKSKTLPCPPNYNNDNNNNDSNDNVCWICLMQYQAEEALRSLPGCQHFFHVVCIDRWLRLKAVCPVCRHSLHPATQAQADHKYSSNLLL